MPRYFIHPLSLASSNISLMASCSSADISGCLHQRGFVVRISTLTVESRACVEHRVPSVKEKYDSFIAREVPHLTKRFRKTQLGVTLHLRGKLPTVNSPSTLPRGRKNHQREYSALSSTAGLPGQHDYTYGKQI